MSELATQCIKRRNDFLRNSRMLKCVRYPNGNKNFEVYRDPNDAILLVIIFDSKNRIIEENWLRLYSRILDDISHTQIYGFYVWNDKQQPMFWQLDQFAYSNIQTDIIKRDYIPSISRPSRVIYSFENEKQMVEGAWFYVNNTIIDCKSDVGTVTKHSEHNFTIEKDSEICYL